MLFNSIPFVFYFFPISIVGFYFIRNRFSPRMTQIYIIIVSLIFYGLWEIRGLYILLFSIIINFVVGSRLCSNDVSESNKSRLFVFIILFNILFLGYYKYTQFVIENIVLWTDIDIRPPSILLPLAISFFTFTQIAFQVDARRGEVKDLTFIKYMMFVTYFPHLIAGPIYHHKEMMPQFDSMAKARIDYRMIVGGMLMFGIGLFKKVVFADSLAPYADQAFLAAANNWKLSLFEAWGGLIAFSMQIYFDFSAYSDMAIGLAMAMNVRMPVNFNSPLRATSIIEIWRRWHMTLGRFLNEYIFLPIALAASRLVSEKKVGKWPYFLLTLAIPMTLTFIVSGLWHGAGWTYVMFGVITGVAMSVNFAWRKAKMPKLPTVVAWLLTMLTFMISLLYFRAQSMGAAHLFLDGLLGIHGAALPASAREMLGGASVLLQSIGIRFEDVGSAYFKFPEQALWILLTGIVVIAMPNSQEIVAKFEPTLEPARIENATGFYARAVEPRLARFFAWFADGREAILGAALALGFAILLLGQSWLRTQVAQFIYFQF